MHSKGDDEGSDTDMTKRKWEEIVVRHSIKREFWLSRFVRGRGPKAPHSVPRMVNLLLMRYNLILYFKLLS